MDHCCVATEKFTQDAQRRRVLWLVLAVNCGMFLVELGAGLFAGSVALQADSLDMLGDALVYGVSLAAVGRTAVHGTRAAQLKGTCMAVFGLAVLAQIVWKVLRGSPPDPTVVSSIGFLALLANLVCLGLLFGHRSDDLNMRSAWICSRNDIVANAGVIASAAAVAFFSSMWPDVVVSLAIVVLFLRSATVVLVAAASDMRQSKLKMAVRLCRNGLCPATACRCPVA